MVPALRRRLDAFAAFASDINHGIESGATTDLSAATRDLWDDVRSLIVKDQRIDNVAHRLLAAAQAHAEADQDDAYERTVLHGWFIAALSDFYRITQCADPRL